MVYGDMADMVGSDVYGDINKIECRCACVRWRPTSLTTLSSLGGWYMWV